MLSETPSKMLLIFLLNILISQLTLSAKSVKTGFYPGRVPPTKFEYPKYNGWMIPSKAVELCEEDLACGGFTFKGAFSIDHTPVEVYFFHFIKDLDDKLDNFNHWSTYRVSRRKYAILQGFNIETKGSDTTKVLQQQKKDRW